MTPLAKNSLGIALLITAACLLADPAWPDQQDQIRAICSDPAMRQAILKQSEGVQRKMMEIELAERCPQIDLPSTPVHEAADLSPEASHSHWIYDARYSPDGRMIVSASRDGTVRVWDAETGKPMHRIVVGASEQAIVRSATFVGDSTRIAVASDDNPVRLYDVASGKVIAELRLAGAAGDEDPPRIAATTGGMLFLAGKDDAVEALDPATQAVRYRLAGHGAEATAIAISETADMVATAATNELAKPQLPHNRRILLWRLGTGEKLAELMPSGLPSVLAFSRDGKQLAVVVGGSADIYDVATKHVVQSIREHPVSDLFAVAFTADGKGLITCRTHPILWDLATGQMVRPFGPFGDLCHSVEVSTDGRFALTTSAGSDVRIWEIATGAFYRRLGINVHPPY
jgi:WD40 repeat protein